MAKRNLTPEERRAYLALARAARRLREAQERAAQDPDAATPEKTRAKRRKGQPMQSDAPPIPRLLLRAPDAAEALGISERTLWAYTKPRGSIPAVKIGGRVLYDPRDLTAWIDRQKGGDDDQAR